MRMSYKKGKDVKKKSAFGMLSVKAGIDKNPKPTQADRIAGATKGKRVKAMGGGAMKKRVMKRGGGMAMANRPMRRGGGMMKKNMM